MKSNHYLILALSTLLTTTTCLLGITGSVGRYYDLIGAALKRKDFTEARRQLENYKADPRIKTRDGRRIIGKHEQRIIELELQVHRAEIETAEFRGAARAADAARIGGDLGAEAAAEVAQVEEREADAATELPPPSYEEALLLPPSEEIIEREPLMPTVPVELQPQRPGEAIVLEPQPAPETIVIERTPTLPLPSIPVPPEPPPLPPDMPAPPPPPPPLPVFEEAGEEQPTTAPTRLQEEIIRGIQLRPSSPRAEAPPAPTTIQEEIARGLVQLRPAVPHEELPSAPTEAEVQRAQLRRTEPRERVEEEQDIPLFETPGLIERARLAQEEVVPKIKEEAEGEFAAATEEETITEITREREREQKALAQMEERLFVNSLHKAVRQADETLIRLTETPLPPAIILQQLRGPQLALARMRSRTRGTNYSKEQITQFILDTPGLSWSLRTIIEASATPERSGLDVIEGILKAKQQELLPTVPARSPSERVETEQKTGLEILRARRGAIEPEEEEEDWETGWDE